MGDISRKWWRTGLLFVATAFCSCAPMPRGRALAPSKIVYTRTIPGGHYYPSRQVHTVYRVGR